jgi:glycosyltransferase involved in cell wall biosynthesis
MPVDQVRSQIIPAVVRWQNDRGTATPRGNGPAIGRAEATAEPGPSVFPAAAARRLACGSAPVRVTVAIPACNAAATLDETLRSVRGQSYRNLEIIVVDDGSGDDTPSIARRHVEADPRVQLISQANGGVSTARNAALARASGELFAAIDADDVWHPDMILRQVRSMYDGPDVLVLSYTWYANIDATGHVLSTCEPSDEGDVVARMCRGNLIGNGSSAIMLTGVLRDVGGWDPLLRHGNEDYKTFFLLAERGRFAVVRSHLLGYRQTRDNRSSKARHMIASYDQVLAEVAPRYPQYARDFAAGRSDLIAYLFDKAVLNRKWDGVAYLGREAWRRSRSDACSMILRSPLILSRLVLPLSIRARLRRNRPGAPARASRFLPCGTG